MNPRRKYRKPQTYVAGACLTTFNPCILNYGARNSHTTSKLASSYVCKITNIISKISLVQLETEMKLRQYLRFFKNKLTVFRGPLSLTVAYRMTKNEHPATKKTVALT